MNMYFYIFKLGIKRIIVIKNNFKNEISEDVSIELNVSQKGC